MPFSDVYRKQAQLLVRTLPLVAEEDCFALKGGTAINLFYRDLPRLSVDIDLTYLPIADRRASLQDIGAALERIADSVRARNPGATVQKSAPGTQQEINKLIIRTRERIQIKIEVSPVLRGTVYAPEVRTICEPAEEAFGFAEMPVLSFADVYAGKAVAALSRQHPRDLFDIHRLLEAEGITDELRTAFIVYLISQDQPPHKLLGGSCRDITHDYEHGFQGMAATDLPTDFLRDAHARLADDLVTNMPEAHKDFLISFYRRMPNWSLLGISGCEQLPAVRWREINLDRAGRGVREEIVEGLCGLVG